MKKQQAKQDPNLNDGTGQSKNGYEIARSVDAVQECR
jgi:hypothetical protein